jgi:hypothetical protein
MHCIRLERAKGLVNGDIAQSGRVVYPRLLNVAQPAGGSPDHFPYLIFHF